MARNIWQFMRQNRLSNRIFKSFDDIVDHCCYAWETLIDSPAAIGRPQVTQSEGWFYLALMHRPVGADMHRPAIARGGDEPTAATGKTPSPCGGGCAEVVLPQMTLVAIRSTV
jgi:hypothetical protein